MINYSANTNFTFIRKLCLNREEFSVNGNSAIALQPGRGGCGNCAITSLSEKRGYGSSAVYCRTEKSGYGSCAIGSPIEKLSCGSCAIASLIEKSRNGSSAATDPLVCGTIVVCFYRSVEQIIHLPQIRSII